MSTEKAKKNYLDRSGPRKMNCAEAVGYAFQETIPLSEGELKSFMGFGSGRAPGGYCGAVYAAKRLLEYAGSPKVKELEAVFNQTAGSTKCREIKALKKLSCLGCVEKAAETVERK